MIIKKIFVIAVFVCLAAFLIYWIWHIGHCLFRRDYNLLDKLIWTLCLLIPIVGLILYRGLGKRMYGKKAKAIVQDVNQNT